MYPMILEEVVRGYAEGGARSLELFVNTDCELEEGYVRRLRGMLDEYGAECCAVHPYTCGMETMMFFSPYERRVDDMLRYYGKYFRAMRVLGAEIFVFHGARAEARQYMNLTDSLYIERYARVAELGREFGIKVAQENVRGYMSRSLDFLCKMKEALGNHAHFVIDTKQALRAEESPRDMVSALGKSVAHVHISDSGAQGDCLPLGQGDADIPAFLNLLRDNSFSGHVILELYRENFDTLEGLVANYGVLEGMCGVGKKGS